MNTEKITEVCKRRGIAFQAAEIYGGASGFWDFGPVGTLLKRKLENYWREFFLDDNIFEIDGATVLPEEVFRASGHIDGFVDPIVQCKKCKSVHRADHLIEEATGKFVEGLNEVELSDIVEKEKIACPSCKGDLDKVRMFNLMLKTEISPVGGRLAYLRPETAQNIFTDFQRLANVLRAKLPFGIAQIGHSFRNEISPRNFLIRVREFTQMEIEMFLDPEHLDDCPNFDDYKDTEIIIYTREEQKTGKQPSKMTVGDALEKGLVPNKYMAYFLAKEMLFYQSIGIPKKSLRFRHMLPEETPHYSKGNFDLEIEFDVGWKETVGNAFRGDYDLKRHMKHSKKDLSMDVNGRKVIPYVVEPSFGVGRTIAAILLHCFREGDDRGWPWFQFPSKLSPYYVAVFPLMKKHGLDVKAKHVYNRVRKEFDTVYDDRGSIGKRYARQDEIGTRYCITIDHQTLEDDTVTIRDRDTQKQERVEIEKLVKTLKEKLAAK
jgi:glycyl-tRNA synthetase